MVVRTPPPDPLLSEQQHRSQTLRQIGLPLAGAGVGLLAIVLLLVWVVTNFDATKVGVMADLLLAVFVLLPLALCLLPLYLVLVIAAGGMGWVNSKAAGPLRAAQRATRAVADRAHVIGHSVNTRVISARAAIAPVENTLDAAFKDTPRAALPAPDADPGRTPLP